MEYICACKNQHNFKSEVYLQYIQNQLAFRDIQIICCEYIFEPRME